MGLSADKGVSVAELNNTDRIFTFPTPKRLSTRLGIP